MTTRGTSHSPVAMIRRHLACRDEGMVTVWSVVIVLACFAMVGLVLDGGVILRARSSTFDLAAESARAGAQQLDQAALANGRVVLDEPAVRQTVNHFLATRGASGDIVISGDRITVTVHRSVDLQILQPASVAVAETATVQAVQGPG